MEYLDLPARHHEVKRIAVIGAGPGGLAALKIFADTPEYNSGLWYLTAFEAREQVGGVWLPAPPSTGTSGVPPTPLYDALTTNLPHPIMCYPSFPFPPSTPLYPRAAVVQTYLESYSIHFNLRQHIQFNTTVSEVVRHGMSWSITAVKDGNAFRADFDLVIVANGHYRVPRLPSTPGVQEWITSGIAMHAVNYRHPLLEYRDAVVLVVGGGPSGTDIAAELRGIARIVVQSLPGGTREDPEAENYKRRPRVVQFGSDGEVHYADGTTERVDRCILATGYDFSFPFLPLLHSGTPTGPPLPNELLLSPSSVFPLARHIFPLGIPDVPAHTLAFLGLPLQVAPFPILEIQARAAIRAFRQPEALDTTDEALAIVARLDALRSTVGHESNAAVARAWHWLPEDEQFVYRDELNAWAGEGADVVPQWVRELYVQKNELRAAWRALEREGIAEDWVRGVGVGGIDEWVDFMYKVLRKSQEDPKRGKL